MSGKKQNTAIRKQNTAYNTLVNALSWNSDTLYSVYIHHKKTKDIEQPIDWERREHTKNRKKALGSAHQLSKSYSHNKIEVKKTYHSPKHGKMIDKTIKIYDEETPHFIKHALTILKTIHGLFSKPE